MDFITSSRNLATTFYRIQIFVQLFCKLVPGGIYCEDYIKPETDNNVPVKKSLLLLLQLWFSHELIATMHSVVTGQAPIQL